MSNDAVFGSVLANAKLVTKSLAAGGNETQKLINEKPRVRNHKTRDIYNSTSHLSYYKAEPYRK